MEKDDEGRHVNTKNSRTCCFQYCVLDESNLSARLLLKSKRYAQIQMELTDSYCLYLLTEYPQHLGWTAGMEPRDINLVRGLAHSPN